MNQDEFRVKIVAHMATTNTRLQGIDKRIGGLEGKVDSLSTEGCAKGGENERRLEKIEIGPKSSIAGASIAGGGIAALITGIVKFAEAFGDK